MAGIPQNFQAISNVLANYNFVDIASGTGYITFYAGNTVDDYLLSNFTYYSDSLYDSNTTTEVVYTLLLDLDFDVVLNRPLDLKGLGIVNIPISISTDDYAYISVIVRKWDGTTETDIVSNDSSIVRLTATGFAMLAVDLNIPLTHFKIGETLRLTIRGYGKTDGGITELKIGHDPKNRTTNATSDWDTSAAVGSQLSFQCPVRLNL